jgi:hypothetical protein
VPDGGGLTKVIPSTVGETEGKAVVVAEAVAEVLAVVVPELVDVAVTEDVAVTDGLAVTEDVAVTDGLAVAVGDGLAGHAGPPRLLSTNSLTAAVGDALTRGLRGIGAWVGEALAVTWTVTTMLSDTCVPCACAFAAHDNVAAPAAATLIMNVGSEARRRDPQPPRDGQITDSRAGHRD